MKTKKHIRLDVFISFIILFFGCQNENRVTPKIKSYVTEAIDSIQTNALYSSKVNWKNIRKEALEKVKDKKETYEVYPVIRDILLKLDDDHSFLQLSDSLITLDKKNYTDNKSKHPKKERKPSPYGSRMKIAFGMHKANGIKVARIFIPQGMRDNQFAQNIQNIIGDLSAKNPCGWIVDLRGNGGGNMWPMLAGVGILAGDSPLGGSVDFEDKRDFYAYKKGKAIYIDKSGKEHSWAEAQEKPSVLKKDLPLAFLIDRGTGSSGEALAIIFKGRKNTKGFGEKTYGASTSTRGFKLSDGANLVLAVSVFEDRNKNSYPDGVFPDVEIPIGNEKEEPENDPMIASAIKWLSEQETCN